MMGSGRPVFPFTALVGQDGMKRALVLNAINPRIGGVLIRGEKGTAKSTAVRALASLLPEIEVIAGCPYACDPAAPDTWCEDCEARFPLTPQPPLPQGARGRPGTGGSHSARVSSPSLRRGRGGQEGEGASERRRVPLVELPVGATEDRVVGTLNLERAIKEGERHFEPGLLAAANRGILYVDEVNLLNDHLVDVLLDAAAMGVNYVEREGVSVRHPAQFILVGTMNPEEGDLRPQLLDRFALAVEVAGLPAPADRATVVRRRIAFEQDPQAFAAAWAEAEAAERARILAARALLPSVRLDDHMLGLITQLCCDFEVDGLRADIVMYKTALTLAAYAGRRVVTEGDVRDAAVLALLHRRRRQPFQQPELNRERLDESIQRYLERNPPPPSPPAPPPPGGRGADESSEPSPDDRESPVGEGEPPAGDAEDAATGEPPGREAGDAPTGESPGDERGDSPAGAGPERVFAPSAPPPPPALAAPAPPRPRAGRRGRRSKAIVLPAEAASEPVGHYVRAAVPRGRPRDLAFDATLRAAAPHQKRRRERPLAPGPSHTGGEGDRDGKVREANPTPGPSLTRGGEWTRGVGLSLSQAPPFPAPGRGGRGERGSLALPLSPRRAEGGGGREVPWSSPPSPTRGEGGRGGEELALRLEAQDLRQKVRETRLNNLILFVVDASGSMGARERMAAAKGAVLALLLDAYRKRDQVGLVAFRGRGAELLLPPTNSVDLAEARLRELPTGGRTPLAHGLTVACRTLDRHQASRAETLPLLVLISDGRANVPLGGPGDVMAEIRLLGDQLQQRGVASVVIDSETGPLRLGLAREVAAALGARYLRLGDLDGAALAGAVRRVRA